MFQKILIANRGEIALRVLRAARELGIKTVAVHSTADAEAMHVRLADESVCIGPPPSRDSYLNIHQIVAACEITGADAIHPGYGFLSENAKFAEILEAPVAETLMGLGSLPSEHPYCINMQGMHGSYAANMGISSADLGYTANALIDGAYAGDYFLAGDKIDLTIQGIQDYAQRTQDIEALPVATPAGQLVPLGAVADVRISSGPEQVNHRERVRAITIEVTPPPDMALETAMQTINEKIVAPIREGGQLDGGYRITLAGTADKLTKVRETFVGKWTGWNAQSLVSILNSQAFLVVIITYLLMAALFESWLYPLVIILTVPIGAVGGILGLWLLNLWVFQAMDVLTMLGFVIIAGTVVTSRSSTTRGLVRRKKARAVLATRRGRECVSAGAIDTVERM